MYARSSCHAEARAPKIRSLENTQAKALTARRSSHKLECRHQNNYKAGIGVSVGDLDQLSMGLGFRGLKELPLVENQLKKR